MLPRIKRKTLEQACTKYAKERLPLKKGGETEWFRLMRISNSFLKDKLVHQITSTDIADFRDKLLLTPKKNAKLDSKGELETLAPATVRLILGTFSNLFEFCVKEWGFARINPVKNVQKPKDSPPRDRILTPSEEKRLLHAAIHYNADKPLQMYVIIRLAMTSAPRQGEIQKMRWEHSELQYDTIHLPDTKTGIPRTIPLFKEVTDLLIKLGPKASGPIFDYTSSGIKSAFRAICKKARVENFTFHDLRHCATTALIDSKKFRSDIHVAAITGHTDLNTLKRYHHPDARKLAQIMNSTGKSRASVDDVVSYPAIIHNMGGAYHVRYPDLDQGYTYKSLDHMREAAPYDLMKSLIIRVQKKERVPEPYKSFESLYFGEDNMLDINPYEYVDRNLMAAKGLYGTTASYCTS